LKDLVRLALSSRTSLHVLGVRTRKAMLHGARKESQRPWRYKKRRNVDLNDNMKLSAEKQKGSKRQVGILRKQDKHWKGPEDFFEIQNPVRIKTSSNTIQQILSLKSLLWNNDEYLEGVCEFVCWSLACTNSRYRPSTSKICRGHLIPTLLINLDLWTYVRTGSNVSEIFVRYRDRSR